MAKLHRHLATTLVVLLLAPTLGACATAGADRRAHADRPGCGAQVRSLSSPAGQQWYRDQGWRFHSVEAAAVHYARLADEASPSPDWFTPVSRTLPPGTRLQMAIGGSQTPEQPGRFGTFDYIDDFEEVRDELAVWMDWKPQVDRVVTYEVTRDLSVNVGPVGPQVDAQSCRLLPGRGSQFQMLVPDTERMNYLRVVSVRPIR